MKRRTHIATMGLLLLTAPIVPLIISNSRRMIAGNGLEPFSDNSIMYVLFLIVFSSAALPVLAFSFLENLNVFRWKSTFTYALIGAAGSTAFMVILDSSDDYFTQPGVGWQWPLIGLLLGATFGAVFKVVCYLVAGRRSTAP